ncbi:LpxL/LpxP family Kdo(2)-lipid IV(A) lauroyl/palmitoleoyl acyltransferase [Aliikangiella sp. IMCC44359]|uniref:LpxL/LpxP family Kdo(2)-lipid IV(A) lauroyl/palmitoleoyl acyltransferase n=1 Tax=Aliikangiella sp. IMCC44359 TaxID=3459125 RepID=UPI00403AB5AD
MTKQKNKNLKVQYSPSYFILRPKYWPALIMFTFVWLIAKLPLLAKLKLARLISWLMLKLASRRKKIAEINLKLCFPQLSDKERQQLLVDNFYETSLGLVETASCWFSDLHQYADNTEIKGSEHLDAALAKDKGVILLSFHMTSLEIGGSLLGKHYPINAMYKPNKSLLVENQMRQGRLRHVKSLLKQSDIRGTVKALKSNKIVWYATDQNYGNKSAVFVPFFGTMASTITATTKFAKLTNATVVPFTQRRVKNGKGLILEIHPPFENFPGANETEDAMRINQYLEKYLTLYPVDYMWLHQRFRTRPPGEKRIYPKK